MKADPHDIKTVFDLERQLFAPLFQRPYVWQEKQQWEPLWRDIRKVAEELLAGNEDCKPHFLGAVVLDQMKVPIGKPDRRSIIDGQQRLTTLQLLVEAVRDLCHGRDEFSYHCGQLETMLYNQHVRDEADRLKLIPTNVDRPVYWAIMETTSPTALEERLEKACAGKRTQLARAYVYFHRVIGEWLDLDGDDALRRCDAIVNAVRSKLRIVVIDMDDQDDAQMIFETLNARGTPLLPSDLVKNFLFRRAQEAGENVEQLHARYWERFDVEDNFWREEMRVGRLSRARIDVFLGHYLSLQKCDEVTLTELFQEYQDFAARHEDRNAEWHLRMFHRYAQHFKRFFEISTDSREGLFFKRLGVMEVTTAMPFLLGLYEGTSDDESRIRVLEDLESFLVRRMVCRLTTKNYNRMFLDLLTELEKTRDYAPQRIRDLLLKQSGDSTRWPDDADFKEAWVNTPLYTAITRRRLRMLLRALDDALHTPKTEKYSLKESLTIEHIMPQHWGVHWPLPKIEGETPEEYVERERRRNQLLHTVGNLTLMTQSLNSDVSDGAFETKRAGILENTVLNLSRFLHDVDEWGERHILERSKALFEIIETIWPYPSESDQSTSDDG